MARRLAGTVVLALVLVVAFGAAPAAAESPLQVEAALDGRLVSSTGANDPVELGDRRAALVRVALTNHSDETVRVASVKLSASALGVTFVAYDAVVLVDVRPDERRVVSFLLPIADIGDQATGLLPATINVYDASGGLLGEQRFTADIQGSATSTYARFGWVLVVFTLVTIGIDLWLAASRRLPPNRFLRGVRFAIPGVGFGLTLCFALSYLGVLAPYPEVWPILVAIPGVGFFLLGLLSPGRLAIEEDAIDVALREHAELVAASAPS